MVANPIIKPFQSAPRLLQRGDTTRLPQPLMDNLCPRLTNSCAFGASEAHEPFTNRQGVAEVELICNRFHSVRPPPTSRNAGFIRFISMPFGDGTIDWRGGFDPGKLHWQRPVYSLAAKKGTKLQRHVLARDERIGRIVKFLVIVSSPRPRVGFLWLAAYTQAAPTGA